MGVLHLGSRTGILGTAIPLPEMALELDFSEIPNTKRKIIQAQEIL